MHVPGQLARLQLLARVSIGFHRGDRISVQQMLRRAYRYSGKGLAVLNVSNAMQLPANAVPLLTYLPV